jgi:hypothetical protein
MAGHALRLDCDSACVGLEKVNGGADLITELSGHTIMPPPPETTCQLQTQSAYMDPVSLRRVQLVLFERDCLPKWVV